MRTSGLLAQLLGLPVSEAVNLGALWDLLEIRWNAIIDYKPQLQQTGDAHWEWGSLAATPWLLGTCYKLGQAKQAKDCCRGFLTPCTEAKTVPHKAAFWGTMYCNHISNMQVPECHAAKYPKLTQSSPGGSHWYRPPSCRALPKAPPTPMLLQWISILSGTHPNACASSSGILGLLPLASRRPLELPEGSQRLGCCKGALGTFTNLQ